MPARFERCKADHPVQVRCSKIYRPHLHYPHVARLAALGNAWRGGNLAAKIARPRARLTLYSAYLVYQVTMRATSQLSPFLHGTPSCTPSSQGGSGGGYVRCLTPSGRLNLFVYIMKVSFRSSGGSRRPFLSNYHPPPPRPPDGARPVMRVFACDGKWFERCVVRVVVESCCRVRVHKTPAPSEDPHPSNFQPPGPGVHQGGRGGGGVIQSDVG